MTILLALGISLGINTLGFVLGFVGRTDRYTDISYSLSFIIIAVAGIILTPAPGWHAMLLVAMVVIWGGRLGLYLLIRIVRTGKDARFDGRRESFARFSRFWILQALSVWIIILPVTLTLGAPPLQRIPFWAQLGPLLWLTGLAMETTSDYQKFRFRNRPENRESFIRSGLWKYSRHPNYFGEILVWWSIWLTALPGFHGMNHLGIIGPLFITILILFVSGVPILEKKSNEKYGHDPSWKQYVAKTNRIVPWFPRGNEENGDSNAGSQGQLKKSGVVPLKKTLKK